MNIKKHIPNAITSGNLLCGCVALVFTFQYNLVWAAYMVGIAAVLDFLDGFAARMLHVHSEIGKQLDSLADMVTFGVVPGLVLYQLLNISLLPSIVASGPEGAGGSTGLNSWLPFLAFLIPIFSALRLAKFNIDTRQTDSFIGVPTPANSILILSIPLILGINGYEWLTHYMSHQMQSQYFFLLNRYVLIVLTILMSYLLVAELPLFALKFKHFKWKGNEIRYIFLGNAAVLLIIVQYIGIPISIFLYVILSIINNFQHKKKHEIQS